MPDAASVARGVYQPRRPQASPPFRLVSDDLHRLQTVYDERFARAYGLWRPVVARVATRYNGWYANRPRGMRRQELPAAADGPGPPALVPAPRLAPTEASRRWAKPLRRPSSSRSSQWTRSRVRRVAGPRDHAGTFGIRRRLLATPADRRSDGAHGARMRGRPRRRPSRAAREVGDRALRSTNSRPTPIAFPIPSDRPCASSAFPPRVVSSTPVDMPTFTVTGLTRQYAGQGGVVDLSFTLAPGTITALVGANGAGKTTALSVLAGFRLAHTGTLQMGALTIPLTAAAARPNMGFVADRPVTDGRLTAWQWLDFVRALRGGTIDTATATALAAQLCLTPADLGQPIGARSLGTQRKIALWVELLVTTDVLLLDEPLTGLDPLAINGLHAALRAFTARGGRVLLSTHLLREAEALASHVIVLAHGRVVANATMTEVVGHSSLYDTFLRLADAPLGVAGA